MNWDELSEEQLCAVTFSGKHLLILGYAGTGKSTVLAARADFLTDSGVPAEKILHLSPYGDTFHSWCQSLLDRFPEDFGVQGSVFKTITATPLSLLTERSLGGHMSYDELLPVVYARYTYARISLREAIYQVYYSRRGNAEYAAELTEKHYRDYRDAIERYIDNKRKQNLYDEVDVQNIIAVTLKDDETVRKKVAGLYEHILVDDLQDINPLQYEILDSLAESCNLFCAGDEAQSICSNLGVDQSDIRKFCTRYPGARTITLTRNYRFCREIQNLAVWVMKKSCEDCHITVPETARLGHVPLVVCSVNKYDLYDAIAEDIKRNVAQYGYKYEDHLLVAASYDGLYGPRVSLAKRGIPCPGRNPGQKAEEDCIRIETIRDSKAREAEICYLWDISPVYWPLHDERFVVRRLEEKRRLLNVALTRARSKVVILCNAHPAYLLPTRSKKVRYFLQGALKLVEILIPD